MVSMIMPLFGEPSLYYRVLAIKLVNQNRTTTETIRRVEGLRSIFVLSFLGFSVRFEEGGGQGGAESTNRRDSCDCVNVLVSC